MLTVHADDIQAIFSGQPLLQPPPEFPPPGSLDADVEEDDSDAS